MREGGREGGRTGGVMEGLNATKVNAVIHQ